MVAIMLIRNTEGGLDYLKRSCHYVDNGERAIMIGGLGVDLYNPEYIYDAMMKVKRYYGKESGNPLIHIVVSFDDCAKEPCSAIEFSRRIAGFYGTRFQTLWAVHYKPRGVSRYHVHLLLNSVSYVDGRMFHSGMIEMNAFAAFVRDVTGRKTTFRFVNKNEYRSGS